MAFPLQLPINQPELTCENEDVTLRRTRHESGLRVLTEQIPGAKSVSIGFWVPVGSRDERPGTDAASASFGSTHFLEHLLFKGTPRRNAYDIAEAFDRIGADHNALTAKELTCYHAKVRDQDLADAVTVLTDMVCSSTLDISEFETERGVILEELAMAADDYGDLAHERFFAAVFGDNALGRPIGGTPETIAEAERDAVYSYYQHRYSPASLVVTAAGAVDHNRLVQLLESELKRAGGPWDPAITRDPEPRRDHTPAKLTSVTPKALIERQSEQVHLLMGTEGFQEGDSRRFAFGLMNAVLGGGMSSRLFQQIREKRGLAYATYSFGGSYSDAGVFGMYAACAPEKAAEVADLAHSELQSIADHGITHEERKRALGQIAGSSALALEDSETRMARLARAELGTGEYYDLDSSLKRYEAVTQEQLSEVASILASRKSSLVAVGKVSDTGL
jgi:predicted Zn-dependent peptidase